MCIICCRFEQLNRYFHTDDVRQNPPRTAEGHDKLAHVRTVMTQVQEHMTKEYRPHREQSVDEAMVAYTGRLSFKQYLPMKPTKRGLKVWMRANPHNGFCHQVQVYTGRQGRNPEKNLASRVVKDLTADLQGNNHHVYMDNFFSSPDLFSDLLDMGVLACGTVRSTRRGMPADVGNAKLKEQGSFIQRQKGPLLATAWLDKKTVNLLSTNLENPAETTTVRRKQKDGRSKEVRCPGVVKDYTEFMNGVDRADQLRATYSMGRKCLKWWRYLFWFLVDVATVNSYVLMKESPAHQLTTRTGRLKQRNQLEFRQDLSKQLIGGLRKPARKRSFAASNMNADQSITTQHWPTKMNARRTCKWCSKKRRTETIYRCEQCQVNLCVVCFKPYHTSRTNGGEE